ncbi:papilin-like isoform X3 [Hyposmocoma kahamanoa]|uniref:papilin-like isoform X3 n=1 Tax=Hyposmocoma kahamanoa TaxID=1477025 RepID=UPI000E6DA17E|nr:papilin-like isoform X3 [Hyposmocoma kahamanoa]
MKTYLFSFVLFVSVVAISCKKRPKFCKLDSDTGPCYGAFTRYYWDEKTKDCLKFSYGGCGGNKNNFETEDACRSTCGPSSTTDVCSLPAVTGPCRAAIPRYYWDKQAKDCLKFSYGGCDGNGNNFETEDACRAKCGPATTDVCSLPAVTGPCRAAIPRYYWDKKAKDCLKFTYGGCDGNENNFETEDACRAKCGPAPIIDICSLPAETGPCRAAMPRYYWDTQAKDCLKFTYGGCDGNKNNFETEDSCRAQCNPSNTDVCSLPAVIGPCKAAIPRYYWDTKAKDCLKFTYGGCNGNENNFETEDSCRAKCSPSYTDICSLPAETGPCRAAFPRYYWDTQAKDCLKFTYGGCRGNENNFETEDACRAKCSPS